MAWTMSRMMDLATGYWASGALSAAVELDLFDALTADGASQDELAARLKASPRHLDTLLRALCALGLVSRNAGRYRLAPQVAQFLDRSSPTCLLDALRFNIDLYPLWGRLAESVRNGKPAIPPGAHLGADPERTRRFALGMHSRAMALAPDLLPALDLPASGELLDLACGAGTFSRLLAEAHPKLRVTQFDLPPVLEVARELAQNSPAGERINFSAGHYLRDPLPGPFDIILYCGALHQESPESAAELLRRIAAALKPGGRLLLVDMMVREDGTTPPFAALFSLTMMLTSPEGRVFAIPQAEQLLEAAGFTHIRHRMLEAIPYTILAGYKA